MTPTTSSPPPASPSAASPSAASPSSSSSQTQQNQQQQQTLLSMEEILEEKQKIKKEIEACIRTNMTQLVQGCKMQREKQVRHYHTDTLRH
jgi:recombinational DNA repair protein (RecF pathway)